MNTTQPLNYSFATSKKLSKYKDGLDLLHEFESVQQLEDFLELREYLILTEYCTSRKMAELSLPGKLKNKVEFIKSFASKIGASVQDVAKMFANTKVYRFFDSFAWDMKKLYNYVKSSRKYIKDIQQALNDSVEKFGTIEEWKDERLVDIEDFLDKHPKMRRISGPILAGLIILIWMHMSFTGDNLSDFNLTDAYLAMKGQVSFLDVFGGPHGTMFINLFLAGAFTGISFPWPADTIESFSVAVAYTLAKNLRLSIRAQQKRNGMMTEDTITANFSLIRSTGIDIRGKLKGKEKLPYNIITFKGVVDSLSKEVEEQMSEKYVSMFDPGNGGGSSRGRGATLQDSGAGVLATTMEFWVDGGHLWIEYNNKKPAKLKDILKSRDYPELKNCMKTLYKHIESNFAHLYDKEGWDIDKRRWEEILFLFIGRYFSGNRDPLDVIITSNGRVTVNFD